MKKNLITITVVITILGLLVWVSYYLGIFSNIPEINYTTIGEVILKITILTFMILVGIDVMASHNILLTKVKKGEIKIVIRNDNPRKILSHTKDSLTTDTTVKQVSFHLFDFFFIGIPFIDKIYTYRFRWNKAIQTDGEYKVIPRDEIVDSVRREARYAVGLKDVETADNVPMKGVFGFNLRVDDVIAFLFGMPTDFLESIQGRVSEGIQRTLGITDVDKVQGIIWENALSALLLMKIHGSQITVIDRLELDPPTEVRPQLLRVKLAQIKKKETELEAQNTERLATAEADKITKTGDATAKTSALKITLEGDATAKSLAAKLKTETEAAVNRIIAEAEAELLALPNKIQVEQAEIKLEALRQVYEAKIRMVLMEKYKGNPEAVRVAMAEAISKLSNLKVIGLGADVVFNGMVNGGGNVS